MGVKNLWDILESCKKKLPLHHLQNKRVCVDLSCWMVQLQSVNRSHCALKDKVYLKGLFHRIRALIALNCSLIFVTDGSIPAIKSSAYRRRLNAGNEVLTDAGDPCKVSAIKRNMGSEFSCMIKEAKFLGGALGIPCLDGIEEGEAQCALLNAESLCDGCFTSDSEAFSFGARKVYRDICLGEGGYVVCYEMDDIERKLGFGRNSLITLAVLLGSDYNQGVRGIGPESACQLVKSIGDAAVLQRLVSEGLSIAKKPKSSKKKCQIVTCDNKENNPEYMKDCNGGKCPTDKQFLEVIKAYLKPKCHLADSDPVKRVLPVYPFSRSQLHQICSQFFDWPPEKTDEYILPKIAERDLRRFANLRSTSSRLSFNIPIYEIPVKCPVSGIVKPRKIQGIDYFEVSWENVNGLETSPVPADLVESACPEKILEFKERKDQEQKQKRTRKPRPTVKANKSAELKEIDNKLNELLLDIERESTASTNAVVLQRLSPETAGTITKLKRLDQKTTTSSSTESKGSDRVVEESNVKGRSYVTSSTSMRTEFVDLLSPSPAVHARGVSKFREAKSIEVIELSESEGEVSPEHARKARELRLFIANIRNETY